MFNYDLVIEDESRVVQRFKLVRGESKKGTYATLSGVVGNEVLPFGKLYVDESKIRASAKASKKAKNGDNGS